MPNSLKSQHGAVPVLILVAIVGIIALLSITSLASFKNQLFSSLFPNSKSFAATANDWYMAGANPQRTSWVATNATNQTEMAGALRPEWYIPIEPYVHPKFQMIATLDTIFVSTAKGLYAFNSTNGSQKWVYPTDMPLGNSPTVVNSIAYVGGYDHKIHAINALTGAKIWTFEAGSGFETNPLVINNVVYMGNRDGNFYAVDATTGQLKWKYQTAGSILYSAAIKPDNSTIYFASNDGFGYALNAINGNLAWKSPRLEGEGFHLWWPVYYSHPTQGDYVIFSGQFDNRTTLRPGPRSKTGWGDDALNIEWDELYPNRFTQSTGQLVGPITPTPIPGDWISGAITFDGSKSSPMGTSATTAVSEYYEQPSATENSTDPAGINRVNHKPWKRTYLVLDASTGLEKTYDFDGDGQKEYAPITAGGITHYGNRFPPVIGNDNVPYQMMDYISTTHIPQGGVVGWKINSPYLRITGHVTGGTDQPEAFAGAGNLIYYGGLVDRQAGSFNISDPTGQSRWTYFDENVASIDIDKLIPGYDIGYTPTPGDDDQSPCCGDKYLDIFGGLNGAYGKHSMAQNPPIPYKGRVYLQVGNSLVAFKSGATNAVKLPTATVVSTTPSSVTLTKAQVQSTLESEIRKIIQSGHLKPGFIQSGQSGNYSLNQSESILDYFHNPFDTFYTLLQARDLITDPALKTDLDNYLVSEWLNYNPLFINHNGWASGAWRDDFNKPPEVAIDALNYPAKAGKYSPSTTTVWDFNPMAWYATWKFTQAFGSAPAVFQTGLTSTPLMTSFAKIMAPGAISDADLFVKAWAHNGYIAGLIGFTNLYDLAVTQGMAPIAGNISPTFPYTIAQVKAMKDTQMIKKAQFFTKNTPYLKGSGDRNERTFNPSRSFIFMVPELFDFLKTTSTFCVDGKVALDCVKDSSTQFDKITPYWFVSEFDVSYIEAAYQPLYDYNSLFQAKARILNQPFSELAKYLDVPAFARGDLFYIQNLTAALSAPNGPGSSATPSPQPSVTPPSKPGDIDGNNKVDIFDYNLLITDYGATSGTGLRSDINKSGKVDILDYNLLITNYGK